MNDKWRDACRKLQNECGVRFEYNPLEGAWVGDRAWVFNNAKEDYRIAQQPIPEQIINYLKKELMSDLKQDVIMMDGEPLERGDTVYSIVQGELTVININRLDVYPIVCECEDGGQFLFSKDFTSCGDPSSRTLFWQKPEIIPPPKRKKKVKVWDWFVEYESCGRIQRFNGVQDAREDTFYRAKTAQKIDGTEREIET